VKLDHSGRRNQQLQKRLTPSQIKNWAERPWALAQSRAQRWISYGIQPQEIHPVSQLFDAARIFFL